MANSSKISRVSKEELAQASASLFASPNLEKPEQTLNSAKLRSYIEKLSNEEIKNFFEPYGYISHKKYKDENNENFAHIACSDFEVILNDFDVAVLCYPTAKKSSTFDYPAFLKYCNETDTAPEQAISDIVIAGLMTPRFPSYAEKRKKYKDEKTQNAFRSLPKEMKPLLKTLNDKVLAENSIMENKGKYGTFDAEEFFKTSYGENK